MTLSISRGFCYALEESQKLLYGIEYVYGLPPIAWLAHTGSIGDQGVFCVYFM